MEPLLALVGAICLSLLLVIFGLVVLTLFVRRRLVAISQRSTPPTIDAEYTLTPADEPQPYARALSTDLQPRRRYDPPEPYP